MMPRRPAPFRVEPLEDRLTPRAGDLDLSFGNQGKASVPGLNSVTDVAVMSDGRIVAVGPAGGFRVVRLTPNGDPDPTFGTNGQTTVRFGLTSPEGSVPEAVALRPDGGVVIVGKVATV